MALNSNVLLIFFPASMPPPMRSPLSSQVTAWLLATFPSAPHLPLEEDPFLITQTASPSQFNGPALVKALVSPYTL